MPRPNIRIKGGPHPATSPGGASDPVNGCNRCRELAAELEQLKLEAQNPGRGGTGLPFRGSSALVVWAALGFCGAGILFALFALIRHA